MTTPPFAGRLYFVDTGSGAVTGWDSMTGGFLRVSKYDPRFPGSTVSNATGPGMLVQTGDGRILTRLDGSDTPLTMALAIDADLSDPASASIWTYDVTGATNYADARLSGGAYDPETGLNWLHWYPPASNGSQVGWVGFNNAGAAVDTAGAWPSGQQQPPGWGVGYMLRDGWLYRGLNADEGTFDRLRLADGMWQRAAAAKGVLFVGFDAAGDLVFLDDRDTLGGLRDKQLLVYSAADVPWSSGIFDQYPRIEAPALRTISMVPAGMSAADVGVSGTFGSGSVLCHDGWAYYSVEGSNYGVGADNLAYGDVLEMWGVNLATGETGLLFAVPYGFLLSDGTFTRDSFADWYSRTNGFAYGLMRPGAIVPPPTTRRYLRPQRHSQRGDGFNMSSAPRHVQGRTRQSTLRNFGIR